MLTFVHIGDYIIVRFRSFRVLISWMVYGWGYVWVIRLFIVLWFMSLFQDHLCVFGSFARLGVTQRSCTWELFTSLYVVWLFFFFSNVDAAVIPLTATVWREFASEWKTSPGMF